MIPSIMNDNSYEQAQSSGSERILQYRGNQGTGLKNDTSFDNDYSSCGGQQQYGLDLMRTDYDLCEQEKEQEQILSQMGAQGNEFKTIKRIHIRETPTYKYLTYAYDSRLLAIRIQGNRYHLVLQDYLASTRTLFPISFSKIPQYKMISPQQLMFLVQDQNDQNKMALTIWNLSDKTHVSAEFETYKYRFNESPEIYFQYFHESKSVCIIQFIENFQYKLVRHNFNLSYFQLPLKNDSKPSCKFIQYHEQMKEFYSQIFSFYELLSNPKGVQSLRNHSSDTFYRCLQWVQMHQMYKQKLFQKCLFKQDFINNPRICASESSNFEILEKQEIKLYQQEISEFRGNIFIQKFSFPINFYNGAGQRKLFKVRQFPYSWIALLYDDMPTLKVFMALQICQNFDDDLLQELALISHQETK